MKLFSSISKELALLLSDKVGLLIMFIMPLFLVFIMSIVQDSAYKIINENKLSLIISNNDKGEFGNKLIALLTESNLFQLTEVTTMKSADLEQEILQKNSLAAIHIPDLFSESLKNEASSSTNQIISKISILDDSTISAFNSKKNLSEIDFYHHPTMQENYSSSIHNAIMSSVSKILHELMINSIVKNIGSETIALDMEKVFNPIKINTIVANNKYHTVPNTTQHNLPAWSIFAVFFMVISLSSNIVKERINGSFLRLKTTPTNYSLILSSKMIVYCIAGILQFIFIFSFSMIFFKYLNLPPLIFPSSIFALCCCILFCVISAASYAIMIGSLTKTQEQANGIGAVSIIIFAAIGGILVPIFVMPEYLKIISNLSPLNWCLEGFYILFLQNGNLQDLMKIFGYLSLFILICHLATYIKLKSEKLI